MSTKKPYEFICLGELDMDYYVLDTEDNAIDKLVLDEMIRIVEMGVHIEGFKYEQVNNKNRIMCYPPSIKFISGIDEDMNSDIKTTLNRAHFSQINNGIKASKVLTNKSTHPKLLIYDTWINWNNTGDCYSCVSDELKISEGDNIYTVTCNDISISWQKHYLDYLESPIRVAILPRLSIKKKLVYTTVFSLVLFDDKKSQEFNYFKVVNIPNFAKTPDRILEEYSKSYKGLIKYLVK